MKTKVTDAWGEVSTQIELTNEGEIISRTTQDVEDIVDWNKGLSTMQQHRKRDFHHKASIPANVVNHWLEEEARRGNFIRPFTPQFDEMLKRKLADPDNRVWRVDGPKNTLIHGINPNQFD